MDTNQPANPKRGRPPLKGARMERIKLALDPVTIDKARTIGRGSVSEGVRTAVAAYIESAPTRPVGIPGEEK